MPSPTSEGHAPTIAFDARQSDVVTCGDIAGSMDTGFPGPTVAFDMRGREGGSQFEGPHDTANIRAGSGGASKSFIAGPGHNSGQAKWAVRRLMPIECERLQAFPDNYTLIPFRGKPAADGPRYKALGNSMAVNVMKWIGRRIDLVRSARRILHDPSPQQLHQRKPSARPSRAPEAFANVTG
ncbi:MAG: DNA cytosine methyltransferase [Pseudolabrys sp.]